MTMTATVESSAADGAKDFDFWMGRWKIDNRRLLERLAGCDEWESFEAIVEAWPLPAGVGNYDQFVGVNWRPGFVGVSLRAYNRATRQWSIYWLDNRTGGFDPDTGALAAPVIGQFRHGVGEFTGPDTYEGRPIVVKYTWSRITGSSAHWEQAFSTDDGRTWETNWTMDMTRLPG